MKDLLDNLVELSLKEAERIEDILISLPPRDQKEMEEKNHPMLVVAETLREIQIAESKKRASKKDIRTELLQQAFKINRSGTA